MGAPRFARISLALAACVVTLSVPCPSLAGASPEPDGIRLNVTRSNANATLSWPLPDDLFVLEWTASFNSMDWQSVSEILTIDNGYCEVTVPLEQGQRFFRLRKREDAAAAFAVSALTGVTNGFITAVLRSDCTSAPAPPPAVGEIVVGPDYVIMTVANGDPLDHQNAQRVVTDAVFEPLMPLYCGLSRGVASPCVMNRVQWNILTYDAGGNPRLSTSPTSGPGFHYCAVTNGYIIAVVQGESATLPSLPPVGQIAVGSDSVIMTIADHDPRNLELAQRLATDAVFESLMRTYCAQPRGTEDGYVGGRAQWKVATYDAGGNLKLSACAASGCDFHECVVSRGYITAVLRSDCTSAPTPPPPVGGIAVGPDYVIMTVADGDSLDYQTAQRFATDAVFESLMPLYCALAQNPTPGCVRNRVQWNLLTYDAGGNPKVSGSPASGPAYHDVGPCSLTPEERIQQLMVWVKVDVAAGILRDRDGRRLTARLNAVLRQLASGHRPMAIKHLERFLREVEAMVKAERLPVPASQPLLNGARAIVTELNR